MRASRILAMSRQRRGAVQVRARDDRAGECVGSSADLAKAFPGRLAGAGAGPNDIVEVRRPDACASLSRFVAGGRQPALVLPWRACLVVKDLVDARLVTSSSASA